jgi:hypothetical protein
MAKRTDRIFVHTLSFSNDVAVLASTCQSCGQTKVDSADDGSLEDWEREHTCKANDSVQ